MPCDIIPIVKSIDTINKKINGITEKIKFGWVYDKTDDNYVNENTILIVNQVLLELNLNNILEPVFINWMTNYDTELLAALSNQEIKYYLHTFGSSKTQILQTKFFSKKSNIRVFNSYSTSSILIDRFNLLRFSSNDGTLMRLIKEYLKDPYDTGINQTATMKYIILTDDIYVNPLFVDGYVKLLKQTLESINVNPNQIIELTFQQIESNNNLLLNELTVPTSAVLYYITPSMDKIVSILSENNVNVGFYSSDAMLVNVDVDPNTIQYLNNMFTTSPKYPQYIISNAFYDVNFVNTVGKGDPVAEYIRNMISFIIYSNYVNPNINDEYIDQRYFYNLDNVFTAYNLSRFKTATTLEIIKRCSMADSKLVMGGYTTFKPL